MTAPFLHQPMPQARFLSIGLLGVAIAMPFGRRNDLIGWAAFLWIAFFAVALWAILIIGIARSVLAWYRDKPSDAGNAEVGQCYDDYVYKITWDSERFCIRAYTGAPVVAIPISNLLEVIDIDALFIENEVKINSPQKCVSFPKSRSARAKIIRLITSRAKCDLHLRQDIKSRRNKMFRQSTIWLPVLISVTCVLILIAVLTPNPKGLNLIWLMPGMLYGLTWSWVFWRFAYSIAQLSASRKLNSILSSAKVNDVEKNY